MAIGLVLSPPPLGGSGGTPNSDPRSIFRKPFLPKLKSLFGCALSKLKISVDAKVFKKIYNIKIHQISFEVL